MGSQQGKFKEEEMKEFEATTLFNRAEIYHAFTIFKEVFESYTWKSDERPQRLYLTDDDYHINAEASVPISHICDKLPSLRANPFKEKMCEMFSVSSNGMLSFVEFLDMASAFSPKNSIEQKMFHAFQIFDDDGNGIISRRDLCIMLDKITDSPGLDQEKKDHIITNIFSEVNKEPECDGLSTKDFHYAISRAPDFASTFSFRL